MSYPFAERIRKQLEKYDAFWVYDGEPRKDKPHALLTSGKHSDGFVNVGKVLKEQPLVRAEFVEYLKEVLKEGNSLNFTHVVGAATSSTDLARDLASLVGATHIEMEKIEDEQGKRQVWVPRNAPLEEGALILHIEELVTTSFSAFQVRSGIRHANDVRIVRFHHYLPTLVERSDPDDRVKFVEQSIVLPLLQLSIRNYEPGPATCRFCAAGSDAIGPKGANWARLTGRA